MRKHQRSPVTPLARSLLCRSGSLGGRPDLALSFHSFPRVWPQEAVGTNQGCRPPSIQPGLLAISKRKHAKFYFGHLGIYQIGLRLVLCETRSGNLSVGDLSGVRHHLQGLEPGSPHLGLSFLSTVVFSLEVLSYES